MYDVAERLNPDLYLALARATFAEMALAGITVVGEYHDLHHGPGGSRYSDPNAMGAALARAAHEVGIRLTLLDTLYLQGGLTSEGHLPLDGVQQRFSDGSVEAWAARTARIEQTELLRRGAAIHSIRAVSREDAAYAAQLVRDRPLHMYVSEQPAENLACQMYYGTTPTELLADIGVLGSEFTVTRLTSLSATSASGRPRVPGGRLPDVRAGHGRWRPGGLQAPRRRRPGRHRHTDQHAFIDPFVEMRELEMHERLGSGERGGSRPPAPALRVGPRLSEPGLVRRRVHRPGLVADFITVDLESTRTQAARPPRSSTPRAPRTSSPSSSAVGSSSRTASMRSARSPAHA
jgi:cytosine/adenosine deaminase-related metal-dependent hydrolase